MNVHNTSVAFSGPPNVLVTNSRIADVGRVADTGDPALTIRENSKGASIDNWYEDTRGYGIAVIGTSRLFS